MAFAYVVIIILTGLVLTAGLWTGVVVLGRAGRGAAWWVMLGGMICTLVGATVYGLSIYSFMDATLKAVPTISSPPPVVTPSPSGPSSVTVTSSSTTVRPFPSVPSPMGIMGMVTGMLIIGCGVILFNTGFAIHAFKVVSLARRAAELERLCAAMAAASSTATAPVIPTLPPAESSRFEGFEA